MATQARRARGTVAAERERREHRLDARLLTVSDVQVLIAAALPRSAVW